MQLEKSFYLLLNLIFYKQKTVDFWLESNCNRYFEKHINQANCIVKRVLFSTKVGIFLSSTNYNIKYSQVENPVILRDVKHFQMENRLETIYVFFNFAVADIVFQEFLGRRMVKTLLQI